MEKRRIWKGILVTLMICSVIRVPVGAAENKFEGQNQIVEPRYANILNAQTTLSINSNTRTAVCNAAITSRTTTKLEVKLELQRYSGGKWVTFGTWSGNKNNRQFVFSKSVSIPKGYVYRTKAVFNCGGETVTKYSTEVSFK